MQKTVTTSLTRSTVIIIIIIIIIITDSETDGHSGVITVALRCGQSVVNWPFAAAYQVATLRVCPAM